MGQQCGKEKRTNKSADKIQICFVIRPDDADLKCQTYHSATSHAILASDVYVCVGIGTEEGANRLLVTADPRMIVPGRLLRRKLVLGIYDGENLNR